MLIARIRRVRAYAVADGASAASGAEVLEVRRSGAGSTAWAGWARGKPVGGRIGRLAPRVCPSGGPWVDGPFYSEWSDGPCW